MSSKPTFYNTDEIVSFMHSIYRDHVDGYNQLDRDGVLGTAMRELSAQDEGNTPVEFEIAYRRIEAHHKGE